MLTMTRTGICNLALNHAGVGHEIADFNSEQSEEARACRAIYETCRDLVLRDFPWPFASKRVTLQLVAENPTPDWAYSYRYPPDCVQGRIIPTGSRNPQVDTRINYELAHDTSGLLIYTDCVSPDLKYTSRFEEEGRYPSDFVMALSFLIASFIVPRLTKGDPYGAAQRTLNNYLVWMEGAKAAAADEEQRPRLPESEFITGRN